MRISVSRREFYGTARTAQLQRSSLSKAVMSPAFNPGTGNSRTVKGLFKRYAIVPVSLMSAQFLEGATELSKPEKVNALSIFARSIIFLIVDI